MLFSGPPRREMTRVLAPGGVVVIVTPGQSPLLDWGLKILTSQSAKSDFADRRQQILPTLLQHFDVVRRTDRLRLLHRLARLYTGLGLTPAVR